MPEGPLDFWESLTLNEILAWAFVLFGCFVLFVHILKRIDRAAQKRRLRKWGAMELQEDFDERGDRANRNYFGQWGQRNWRDACESDEDRRKRRGDNG